MARFADDEDARRLGEALAALRRARGLSQAEAGARVGMTSQGWGLYETGRRPGLFRPDVQRRLTAAVDATPEALMLAAGDPPARGPSPPVSGLASAGRDFRPAAVATRRMRLSDDGLAPWAASGTVIEYDPDRWPRRDQGCVVETTAGEVLVRLYDGADDQTLRLRGGGGLDVVETRPRATVARVSAVIARHDP